MSNPYEDESWVPGPNHMRDSEPCDGNCEPDEEHLSSCRFWREPAWPLDDHPPFGANGEGDDGHSDQDEIPF